MAKKPKPEKRRRLRRRTGFWHNVRANFLTGLVVVVPVVLTIWLTWSFITFVDAKVVPWVPAPYNPRTYFEADIPGFGLVIFLIFTSFVGYLAKRVFGRQLIRLGEDMVARMPVVRSIYNAAKQIVETILSQSKSSFRQACLVEYPRKGLWAVAFVAADSRGEIVERTGESDMMSVFLPTTPNPTSGFLLFVPRKDVVLLDMTIEEAAKLIISAGLVVPATRAEREAAARNTEARKQAIALAVGARDSVQKI